jgi:hypothetical protein
MMEVFGVGSDLCRGTKRNLVTRERDLIDMSADVAITDRDVTVRFHRRAHLPIVLDSDLFKKTTPVPWWNGLPLRFVE